MLMTCHILPRMRNSLPYGAMYFCGRCANKPPKISNIRISHIGFWNTSEYKAYKLLSVRHESFSKRKEKKRTRYYKGKINQSASSPSLWSQSTIDVMEHLKRISGHMMVMVC